MTQPLPSTLTSVPMETLIFKATIESLACDLHMSYISSASNLGPGGLPWAELAPAIRAAWRLRAFDLLQEALEG
jgi:hypothetical protein